MAKTTLPTNYVDDVLNGAMDGKRRYREIPNADGTISLEDATTYDQIGSNFGASQVNLMNDNINQSFDANKMLKTMDEVNAVTQEGYGVDALVVKELNNSLVADNSQQFQFAYDSESGKYGYKVKEADTDVFVPFSSGNVGFKYIFRPNTTSSHINGGNITFEFDFEPKEFIFVITEYNNGFVRVPLNCEFGEALDNPFLKHVSHDDLQITVNDTYILPGGNYVYCFYK